ncbi:MAG: hypothetical protein NDI75_14100 [Candidatus Didemnitutus sp.]|nr:hypothetical protein [Candidatus Didemnitutus sp.]
MKPVYEMAVMNVQRLYPGAQDARLSSGDARFRDTLHAILSEDYHLWLPEEERPDSMFEEAWRDEWKPRFIPDLWKIDRENKTIHLYEVEDTHPLTQKKLMQLHDYWWAMDAISWTVTLTVFDRYGVNPRVLDLTNYAFHMLPVIRRETEGPNQSAQTTPGS